MVSAASRCCKRSTHDSARNTSAVSITSWLVAPKWTCCACSPADLLPDLPHEFGHDDAVAGRACLQSGDVRPEGFELADDGFCSLGWDQAALRFGLGEHGLEADHRRDLGVDANARRHLLVAKEAGEEGMIEGSDHMSKNTVSLSPCRWMSKA